MMSKLRNLSSERLPHDVVIDILTRLPVKSLIRFRCVSKSWYSTITDPIFITKHSNLQLNNKAKSLSSNNNHNGFLLYTHDELLYTAACNGGPTLTLTEVSKFQIPFPVNHYMVDHCNGMFLIYGNRDALIYLWNPNIQKFKMLTIAEGRSRYSLGLAYHCQNNDFKILKIVCNNKGPRFEAKVYALSTDLWRRIEFSVESIPNLGSILDIQYEPFLFFNGALHCMAYTRGKNNTNNFILSFDVNDEIFREIRLPENYLDGFIFVDRAVHRLVVFKGSLALIVFGLPDTPVYEDGEVLDKCDMWVMGQYGVVESWTKKTVGLGRIKNFFGCTESGQLLIIMRPGRTVSYDPESLYDNNIGISSPNWMAYTTDLMESLVLLDHK